MPMKKPLSTPATTDSRWLMILPVAALALGCESKTAETSQAPTTELTPEKPAESENPKAAEPVSTLTAGQSAAPLGSGPPQEVGPGQSATAAAEKTAGPARKPALDKKPADAPEAAPLRRGAAAKGEGYTLFLEGKSLHQVNQPSAVSLVLLAEDPFKCNEQYPYRFTAAPNPGIQYTESVVRSMNVTKHRSTMTIPFTPSAAGAQTISGELAFSVCTEDKCLIEKQNVSLVVDVGGS